MQSLAQHIEEYRSSRGPISSPSILTRLAERLREVEGATSASRDSDSMVVGILLDRTEQTFLDLTHMDVPPAEVEKHDALTEAFALYFEAFEELLHRLETPESEEFSDLLADIDSIDGFVAGYLDRGEELSVDARL